jgi:Protein of unknown function (DUF3300)
MNKLLITIHAVLLVLSLAAGQAALADSFYSESALEDTDILFTAEELDDLLAPIALYPDPLIAQILPAATFIDQIDEAARYVGQYGKAARIDDQSWDVSVKAVAYYPNVLLMMDQKYDWTVSLGQAFVNQQPDVMDAIQRLRAEALALGNLVSTREQQVVVEEGFIRIIPAEPEVIYVPQYDPLVVYLDRPPSYGFITFGIGFTIGAWLNRDLDWQGRRVYYHGWRGGGWISRASPYIRDRRNIYVNNRYTVVNVNRRVVQQDTRRFRNDIRSNVQYRREHTARPVPPGGGPRPLDRGVTQGVQPRPVLQAPRQAAPATRPAAPAPRPPERPVNSDVSRGRDIQRAQPVSQSGYGGYGKSKDAATFRERGQTSRGNMRQINRPAPVQPTSKQQPAAPVQQPAASGTRQPASRPVGQPARRQSPRVNRGEKEQRQR